MPTGDDVRRGCLLEAAHGIEPLFCLEGTLAVVPLQAVVEVLRRAVLHVG